MIFMTVEQVIREHTFLEMGYKSSTDYAVKKTREELLHELRTSLDVVAEFEKKYGMTYTEFIGQFHALMQFGLFEREDDSMDWHAELEVVRVVEKRLGRLTL